MPPPVWYPFGVYREGKALTQPDDSTMTALTTHTLRDPHMAEW